jgi:hypothetical protein
MVCTTKRSNHDADHGLQTCIPPRFPFPFPRFIWFFSFVLLFVSSFSSVFCVSLFFHLWAGVVNLEQLVESGVKHVFDLSSLSSAQLQAVKTEHQQRMHGISHVVPPFVFCVCMLVVFVGGGVAATAVVVVVVGGVAAAAAAFVVVVFAAGVIVYCFEFFFFPASYKQSIELPCMNTKNNHNNIPHNQHNDNNQQSQPPLCPSRGFHHHPQALTWPDGGVPSKCIWITIPNSCCSIKAQRSMVCTYWPSQLSFVSSSSFNS